MYTTTTTQVISAHIFWKEELVQVEDFAVWDLLSPSVDVSVAVLSCGIGVTMLQEGGEEERLEEMAPSPHWCGVVHVLILLRIHPQHEVCDFVIESCARSKGVHGCSGHYVCLVRAIVSSSSPSPYRAEAIQDSLL